MKIVNKVLEVGFLNTIIGSVKRAYYTCLWKRFAWEDKWHVSPIELRGYQQAVVKFVNSNGEIEGEVVDIGCGLGEILRKIKVGDDKVGYDLDDRVIEAAKYLDKSREIKYQLGTFEAIGCGRKVAYLLTLGFTQSFTEEELVPIYDKLSSDNDIKYFVVDVFSGIDGNRKLCWDNIMPNCYCLYEEMGPFLAGKMIRVYKKQ